MRYQDFHIRIEPDANGGFEAQVLTSSYGTAKRTRFELPFSEPQLKALPNVLERLRDSRRRTKEVYGFTAEKIGDGLFRSLFAGEVGIKFHECLSNIEGSREDQGLRILLEFDLSDPKLAALAALPWELLWNAKRDDFLTRLRNTSVARFLPADRPPLPRIESPLKMLVVMSRPRNLPALDLTKEWTALSSHPEIQLTPMYQPSRKALRAKLLGETWHVLHFMGHGGIDKNGEGLIFLENPEGDAEVVTARDFADTIKGTRDLRLVFLNACRTGVIYRNGRNPFTGTATALTLAGAPAVIAMQASINDQPAVELSSNFYLHIAARNPVDAALAEARLALERTELDWAMPVLFTRVANGRILGEEEAPTASGISGSRENADGSPDEEKGLDPMGPVFLSYRASDGRALATDLAWALRSAGVPVWHDVTDLPPGDTPTRLQEALTAGLSGALLLVTSELGESRAVREIEVPDILRLAQRPAFTFAIASVVETAPGTGELDYTAPDRLLSTPGTLATCKQYKVSTVEGIAALTRDMVLRRMKAHRQLGQDYLVLDLQTRSAPQADVSKAGLVIRTLPPPKGKRAPSPTIWQPLQDFLSALPQLLEASGAQHVKVRGGAHLTVAFSLGAALPSTSRWPLAIESPPGQVWSSGAECAAPALVEDTQTFAAAGKPVAVLVDLVPTPQPVDAFADYLKAHPLEYSAAIRISAAEPRPLKPEEGAATAMESAHRIRQAAHSFDTHRVHLFLRTSFPMAVLLGRLLNTLETTLYEWEDGEGRPFYLPAVTVASGRGAGPILAVHGIR